MQLAQPVFRRVARNNRRVDRADGNAGNPIGLDARFAHRLVNPGLIGAERAAALQNERDAIAALGAPAPRLRGRRDVIRKAGPNVMHGKALEMAGGN